MSRCNITFEISHIDENNISITEIQLQQKKPARNIDSEASIHISFKNKQDSIFLRLDKITRNSYNAMINFELNKLQDNQILSRNYTNCNPWKNDFKDNLPILLIPRNAGSETNAFLTNFGKDNCLGIIDSNGNVSHPIKMTMRASQETRFYLYLYTPLSL